MGLPKIYERSMRGGWAPGEYFCNCRKCGESYIGAKQSSTCADCAYAIAEELHHASDCATHNEPTVPNAPCNCRVIRLTGHEIQSGSDRQAWAEGLIRQLPATHDGRNYWLLNYGRRDEAKALRAKRKLRWDNTTQAAEISGTS